MKVALVKGSTSVILTVKIRDARSSTGAGLGSLDQTSSIVGGYVRMGGTGVALAVDENVTTEGTYEAPSVAGKVRIGTPANMRTGTYELHFHNDLFAAGADILTITLGGATNMVDLDIEVQLTTVNLNGVPEVDVTKWLGTACATPTVAGVPETDPTHWKGTALATPDANGYPKVTVKDGAGTGEINTDAGKIVEVSTLTGHTVQTGDGFARLAAPAGASVSADIAAIKADTGTTGVVLKAAGLADDAANEIADALLDRSNGIETSYTPRQALRLILSALAGKLSGAATTTVTIRDVGDGTDRIIATVDAHGNRTALTLDVT